MDAKERQRIEELIDAHKERKHRREVQLAKLGINADPSIETEIAEIDAAIQKLEQQLKNPVTTREANPYVVSGKPEIGNRIRFEQGERTRRSSSVRRPIAPVYFEPIPEPMSGFPYLTRGRLLLLGRCAS